MPPSDYQSTGGSLKLKGVTNAGVKKKKKSKRPKLDAVEESSARESSEKRGDDGDALPEDEGLSTQKSERRTILGEQEEGESQVSRSERPRADDGDDGEGDYPATSTKTESELRHERHKKQRLLERLKKDPNAFKKTHKEKVEELNRYLSGLSEHHDMPKIGPG